MNCGTDPVNEDVTIIEEDYQNDREIIIKTKEVHISLIHKLMSEEVS